jgi:hypothetical protein
LERRDDNQKHPLWAWFSPRTEENKVKKKAKKAKKSEAIFSKLNMKGIIVLVTVECSV